MRASWVVVLVAACGGGGVKDLRDTPQATPEATCRTAGTKLIELVVTGQDPAPPDDAVNKLIALVEKRCETDTWKSEARGCFSAVKTVEDADACAKTLTEQQLANLSGDMAPSGQGNKNQAAPGGGATGEGAPAPADPCDGGE